LGNFALSSNDHIRFGEVSTLSVIFPAPNVNPLVAKLQSVNFAGVKYQGVKFTKVQVIVRISEAYIIATTLESLYYNIVFTESLEVQAMRDVGFGDFSTAFNCVLA
jgi:hypothetical protein